MELGITLIIFSHGSTASVNIEAFAQNRDSKDKQNNTKSQKWVNEN